MALDLNKIRQKLDKLNNTGGGNKEFLSLNEGEQDFRIIPTALDESNDPFQEAWMHYGLGVKGGFLCPKKNFGQPCKACEVSYQFWDSYNNTSDDKDKALAKEFMAKRRFYSPGVLREDGEVLDSSPVWWGYSKTNYELLIGWVLNKKVGDFTDPEEGRDLTITYIPKDKSDTNFAQTSIMYDPSKTSLGSSKQIKEIVANVKPLFEILSRKTSDEVEGIVDDFINQGPDGGTSRSQYGGAKKDAFSEKYEELNNS